MSIEHVIPQSCTHEDFKTHYSRYGALKRKRIYFVDPKTLQTILSKKKEVFRGRRSHPHFIAYENLVASCKGLLPDENEKFGRHCCNHKRENKKIIPIFFLNNVPLIIKYEKDGELTYPLRYEETIDEVINLKYLTLKRMRKAWAEVYSEYSLHEITSATGDRIKDIVAVFSSDLRSILYKETYWKLFLQYRWFYSYFQNQH
ncbi:MAG: hypothetical protein LBT25_04270 [Candidatus Symbiothrix sp.]|jgi:hypothetical protein|nr:hypothetical protein [Candidatus Symbiothrix sp.]